MAYYADTLTHYILYFIDALALLLIVSSKHKHVTRVYAYYTCFEIYTLATGEIFKMFFM